MRLEHPFSNGRYGSFATEMGLSHHVRFPPVSDRTANIAGGPVRADIVAKVENRSAPKIWRKLILGYLRGCVTFQRRWEGPWLILDETIWSPTSARAKCISGSENFRPSPQKDFCNNICHKRTHAPRQKQHLYSITSSARTSSMAPRGSRRRSAVCSIDLWDETLDRLLRPLMPSIRRCRLQPRLSLQNKFFEISRPKCKPQHDELGPANLSPSVMCSVMSQPSQQPQNSTTNQDWRDQDKAPASGRRARGPFLSRHSTE